MFKQICAVIKLSALVSVLAVLSIFSTSIAQVSSPQNLKVVVENDSAKLIWDAPEEGTAVQYIIYKAYTSDESAEPGSLQFSRSDSTTFGSYIDDLSQVSESNPVVFYYITAMDASGKESSPSNYVNASASKKENSDD